MQASTSRLRCLAALALLLAAVGSRAWAQDQIRHFTDPILVLDTGGHHAPVKALIFTADEAQLLSAGRDKVVHVWDLAADPPRLVRTIRPPIWRGSAGAIFAMALGPVGADGHGTLAMAGFGVENRRGNIGLFRFPGAADRPTGDVIGYLHSGGEHLGRTFEGHTNSVSCMAIDPTGNRLATGSVDRTIRLWDLARRAPLAVLDDPRAREVRAIAFADRGRKLVSGGADGVLRVWDVRPEALRDGKAPAPLAAPPVMVDPNDPRGVAINALVVVDHRFVVLGREDGRLLRYDLRAANPATAFVPFRTADRQGAVEALAVAPDGRLAVSLLSRRLTNWAERPSVTCDVEIRRMPDGVILERVFSADNRPTNPLSNIGTALAFSPKGKYLAIAGGDTQSLFLKDLTAPGEPVLELKGQGRSIWDVAFAGEGMSVGYSFDPPGPAGPPNYWSFDLPGRTPGVLSAAGAQRRIESFDGWSVAPRSPLLLDIVHRDGRRFTVALDPGADRRWWAYSFIPPGPGHQEPTLAVACEVGVAIYTLDGIRTRFLHGHEGPVYCLAPSPDGRWLATGSADQTVRLWTLAGCDTLPGLGATFDRLPDGTAVVREVAPRSFAEGMGLDPGDIANTFALGGKFVDVDPFLRGADRQPPNTPVEVIVRRVLEPIPGWEVPVRAPLGTTRRNAPSLSLFVADNREWVLWMPRGYYDTSIEGDARFLGWHLNRASVFDPRPTDYLEILRYEAQLRQPPGAPNNVIDALLAGADEVAALAVRAVAIAPERIVERDRPPSVRTTLLAPAALPPNAAPVAVRPAADAAPVAGGDPLPGRVVADAGGSIFLSVLADPGGDNPPADLALTLDGRPIPPRQPPAADGRERTFEVPVAPGPHRIALSVEGQAGVRRVETIDLEGPAAPPANEPSLRILAFAPEFADASIPPFPFALQDAEDLAPFLGKHLVADRSGEGFEPAGGDRETLLGGEATSEALIEALRDLDADPPDEGDMVVLVVESHLLGLDGGPGLLAADSSLEPPRRAVAAAEVAERLGRLATYGCKVVVLLDASARGGEPGAEAAVKEWVRDLRNNRGVITFLASTHGPSRALDQKGHRAFAQAVLDSISEYRPRRRSGRLFTLHDFGEAVRLGVLGLTGRRQNALGYLPDTVRADAPFLDPKP